MPNVHIMTPTRWLVLLTFVGAFVVALSLSMALAAEPVTSDMPTASEPVAPVVDTGPTPHWAQDDPALVVTDDPTGFALDLYRAVRGKDYWYATGLFLCLLTWAFRVLLTPRVPWFGTDRGGIASLAITSLLAAFALALLARQVPGWTMIGACLLGAFTAAGGWVAFKRLAWPK